MLVYTECTLYISYQCSVEESSSLTSAACQSICNTDADCKEKDEGSLRRMRDQLFTVL